MAIYLKKTKARRITSCYSCTDERCYFFKPSNGSCKVPHSKYTEICLAEDVVYIFIKREK